MNKNIEIGLVKPNTGQIKGLPKNPRFIKDVEFQKLIKDIKKSDEFLKARPLLVVPHDDKYIIIGGEQRFKACVELGKSEVPCYVFAKNTPVKALREYVIIDNKHAGQFDMAAIQQDWALEFGFQEVAFDFPKNNDNDVIKKESDNSVNDEIDIDFDNIQSNQDRAVAAKEIKVSCPNCNHCFNI
jgi:ParB-like nuclease domain